MSPRRHHLNRLDGLGAGRELGRPGRVVVDPQDVRNNVRILLRGKAARRCLRHHGGDHLVEIAEPELPTFFIRGATCIKSLEEIRQFLNEHNLHFGMKIEEGEDGELFLVDERSREGAAAEQSADATLE